MLSIGQLGRCRYYLDKVAYNVDDCYLGRRCCLSRAGLLFRTLEFNCGGIGMKHRRPADHSDPDFSLESSRGPPG